LSAVVLCLRESVVVGVLNQLLKWFRAVLGSAQRIMQHVNRELLSIHSDYRHSWTDASFGGGHAFNRVGDMSIVTQPESYGIRCIDVFPGGILFGFDEFRTVFVVSQFPAAALDTRQRRARPMIIQPLSPETAPIIGSNLVQRVHDIVEIVRL